MVPKKSTDILRSSRIVRAEEMLHSDDVPPIVREAHQVLKSEIVAMRMAREIAKNNPDQRKDNGTHPAVTGLSVGGAKEVVDYFLALASTGDPYAQDLLSMSFVDGGLTALIATIAAWITKPNKKSRKSNG
jgi:hypothetical protein